MKYYWPNDALAGAINTYLKAAVSVSFILNMSYTGDYLNNAKMKFPLTTAGLGCHDLAPDDDDGVDVSVSQLRDYLRDTSINTGERPVASKRVPESGPKILQVSDIQFRCTIVAIVSICGCFDF